jgi:hypothetical protein
VGDRYFSRTHPAVSVLNPWRCTKQFSRCRHCLRPVGVLDRALQYFLRYGQAEILKELPAERVKLEFNLRGLGLGGEQAAFRTSIISEKQIDFLPTRTRSESLARDTAIPPITPATIAAIPMLGGLHHHYAATFGPRFGRYRGTRASARPDPDIASATIGGRGWSAARGIFEKGIAAHR